MYIIIIEYLASSDPSIQLTENHIWTSAYESIETDW